MTSADQHGVYLTHEEHAALLAERDRLRDENQKLHHLLGQAATWIEFTALLMEGSDKRPNILGEIAAALKGDQT